MKTSHLSSWEQEEYVLQERTPQMLIHVAECTECRATVERMEQAMGVFRSAAVAWSSESLAKRAAAVPFRHAPAMAARWAMAALIPVALLVLAFVTFSRSGPPAARPIAAISDDALLDQVDEQLSVAVPSSMESLTHLVSAENSSVGGGGSSVQSN